MVLLPARKFSKLCFLLQGIDLELALRVGGNVDQMSLYHVLRACHPLIFARVATRFFTAKWVEVAFADHSPLVFCSPNDIGCECASAHDTRFRPERLLVYDKQPDGIGIAVQVILMLALCNLYRNQSLCLRKQWLASCYLSPLF